MKFSPKQLATIRKPFRDGAFEVSEGTPRSGKTTAGAFRFARFVMECPERDFLVLAYSQEQAHSLLVEGDGYGLRHIFGYNARIHKDRTGSNLTVLHTGVEKHIYLKGGGKASDFKAFQGRSFGGVYFCELSLLNPDTVREAFRRTIASRLRCHFADLNPPPPHHWAVTFMAENPKTDWTHWTMADNPILSEGRIKDIEESLKGNPYLYQRDFLGLRAMPEGLIYNMWDDAENVREGPIPDDEQIAEMWFAADGGVDHATCVICFLATQTIVPPDRQWIEKPKHKGVVYIADEYYYSGAESGNKAMSLQAEEIAKFVGRMLKRHGPRFSKWRPRPAAGWSRFFVDPACLALSEELKLKGISAERADNNQREGVNAGIERIQDLILRRKVKLLNDDRRGTNHGYLLKEMNGYAWDKNGNPVKVHDDCMDAMRYGLNYYIKTYGG